MATHTPDRNQGERFRFDTSDVDWKEFIPGAVDFRILEVNVAARTVDLLAKFAPGKQCFNHRHVAQATTLVLEGELHIIEKSAQGDVRKVKPAGSFSSGAVDEVHIEGGGVEGALVYFSLRGHSDRIYDMLNEDLTLMQTITVQDFARDWEYWLQAQAA